MPTPNHLSDVTGEDASADEVSQQPEPASPATSFGIVSLYAQRIKANQEKIEEQLAEPPTPEHPALPDDVSANDAVAWADFRSDLVRALRNSFLRFMGQPVPRRQAAAI